LTREAIKLDPSNPRIHGGLLYLLYFVPGLTRTRLIEEHRTWAARHADPLKSTWLRHANPRQPDKVLRVGYVSPDFRIHPIGRFMLPLFVGHDRSRVEAYAYSHARQTDALSDRIKQHAAGWRDIREMNDDAAADLIRRDGIDILVDLAMHMGDNRLGIFARKPAPIQVTYLAYPGTTGMDAIDYLIVDPEMNPSAESSEDFVENPLFIPRYWCYKPSIFEFEPVQPPCIKNGFVTFGCLNNFCKINATVRQSWIELLHAVPGSRLMIHAHEGEHRARFVKSMAAAGIKPGRISFVPLLNLAEYTRQYQLIDIALDTFPYTGGTTTCDALWMGVPVVTLAGDMPFSRGGVSILSAVGRRDLIASTPQEYVRIAASLANDRDRLIHLHAILRESLSGSDLGNYPKFADSIETAFRTIWQQWCGGSVTSRSFNCVQTAGV
jgi:predicted O-linked N-acetylglucosamine transferase (SPINDLY family)